MKRYVSVICSVGLAVACLITIGCSTQSGTTSAPPPNSGQLLINRAPNFGSNLALVVSVDGKDMGSSSEGQYYRGYWPAGQKVLTARVDRHQGGACATPKALN